MTETARVSNTHTHMYRNRDDRDDWIILIFPNDLAEETLLVATITRQDKTYIRDVEGSIALRRSLTTPNLEGESLQ